MYVCLFMYAATTTGGTDFFCFFFLSRFGL
jgi:hypothetical protein